MRSRFPQTPDADETGVPIAGVNCDTGATYACHSPSHSRSGVAQSKERCPCASRLRKCGETLTADKRNKYINKGRLSPT